MDFVIHIPAEDSFIYLVLRLCAITSEATLTAAKPKANQ